ncbi:glycerophosphoryl diester phosphodiesterase [Actinoalloteichus hoggarensis]|uniref:Putative glycerophosphoryl diester phosphodiesterase 1 n=1 Tax=Actinoalloteichus hoggarensis TaxID=1470176 RepID=A0A221VY87_9PSEU|nr:glycerophosphodiester phosphodiesterase [Actinoalloteichus hoggarensis]ASO18438.1 putative glycerophosphoryl diester phosphodiesterase 1 [Actinoalloteichus hoggarensis]MBB5921805.1 glycerophosphoryl diester phosphodiesterase [Actinoalloteichus hoggarensis]
MVRTSTFTASLLIGAVLFTSGIGQAAATPAPVAPAAQAVPDVDLAGPPHRGDFDIQAHRGGMAYLPEGTLPAFENALRIGVTTLELDIQITADGREVVTHDRLINPARCRDTAPVFEGDPDFPYAGRYVHTLTFAQVRTLDCGSQTHPDYPEQRPAPGEMMPTLREVFALVRRCGAHDVRFNIETKVEAGAPEETAPREEFVRVAAREIRRAGMLHRTTIQSFDWGALMLMRRVEPRLPLIALTEPNFLQVGEPGRSPWLGGLDIDDFDGSPVQAARSFGASALSPVHGTPQHGGVGDPDYVPFTTRELVEEAHEAGMTVVPWTINDTATMHKLIDDGVDGIITDYPRRLRAVAAEHGFELPKRYRHGHCGGRG